MYAEEAPVGSKSPAVLHGCPGLEELIGIGKLVRGLFTRPSSGELYVVIDRGLYRITEHFSTDSLGTIGGSGRVGMADNGQQLCIAAGKSGYIYTEADGLKEIEDESFPGASTVTALDGYFIFSNPNSGQRGQFFISSVLDGEVYDATDFATAESYPDDLMRVFADHSQLLLFGSETIEIWFNSGNASFPFTRAQGSVIEQGLGATWTVAKLDETVAWLDNEGSVRMLQGTTPVRISTHAVEYAISKGDWSKAVAWSYTEEGHQFYVLTVPPGRVRKFSGYEREEPGIPSTHVYDAATQLWHERSTYAKGYWRAGFYAKAFGKHVVAAIDSGRVYEMSLSYYRDANKPIISEIQFPQVQSDGKRFIVHSLQLDMEVATVSEQFDRGGGGGGNGGGGPVESFRAPAALRGGDAVRDGDGHVKSFGAPAALSSRRGRRDDEEEEEPARVPQVMLDVSGNTRTFDQSQAWRSFGGAGEYDKRVIWRRLGQHRSFTPKISISDGVKRAVFAAYAEIEVQGS
nr:packaged DNA stabilization protein [uncultured Microbulbifer sp.]